jgi:hypothetical protein
MALKVKRANSDIDNILDQVDDFITLSETIIKHSKKLKKVIEQNKEQIINEGVDQALCAAGAKHFMPIHSHAQSLFARSWMCHNRLEDYILPDVNEGGKTCP